MNRCLTNKKGNGHFPFSNLGLECSMDQFSNTLIIMFAFRNALGLFMDSGEIHGNCQPLNSIGTLLFAATQGTTPIVKGFEFIGGHIVN